MNDGNIVIDGFNLKHQIIAEHESVEKWKSKIFIKTYWGGEVEMQILSQVFKVKIKCICRLQSRFNNEYGYNYEDKIMVTLKNNHYKSILLF